MHLAGLLGMPRRVATYPDGLGWTGPNLVSTAGAFVLAAGLLLLVVNVVRSLRRGPPAGPDPWGGDTLEWLEASPPPEAQFPELPVVRTRHPRWEQDTVAGPDPAAPDPAERALAATLAPLRVGPTTWRGALVVSAVDARPLAIVHVPGPTMVPFVVASGFTVLLVAALVHGVGLALLGAAITAGGVAAWFWPRASERRAIEELGSAVPGRLPLAMAGPAANGWWATWVLVLVLATALVTLAASHVYLAGGRLAWGAPPPALAAALGATAAIAVVAAATPWAVRTIARRAPRARRVALGAASAALVGFTALSVAAYQGTGAAPALSAHGSMVLGLVGFQWLVAGLLLVMLGIAQLWAWLAPADPRGHGVTWNAALVSAFAAVSWLVALALVFLAPRVG
jgi:hypothetical protein